MLTSTLRTTWLPPLAALSLTTAVTLLGASCMPDQVMVRGVTAPVCGNGDLEGDEECDDGNNTDGDGCSASCQTEPAAETDCADGLDNDGDGLVDCGDPDCQGDPACASTCGDGILDPGEGCDDGNNTDGDGCSALCELEVSVETICDDRVDNDSDGLVDCADTDCRDDAFCLCGNGVLDPGEACDDGNNIDGDGCSSSCQLEG